ncbi:MULTISPECIES: hypothetical protein [unclassified Microcoleus]
MGKKVGRTKQAGIVNSTGGVFDPLPITNQLLPVINYQLTVSNL